MEICYKRDPRGSFMIIEGQPHKETYEDIMVRENNVKSILNSYSAEIDSRLQYWYNISGKRSLQDYVDEEGLSIDFVINLFEAINYAYGRLTKYLIDPSHIFLTPESLFLDSASDNVMVYLCYMPFEKDGNRDGFSTITECLTDGIRTSSRFSSEENDEKQRMVELIYKLYDISLRDEYCLERLMEEVRKYEEKPEIIEKENVSVDKEEELQIEEKTFPVNKTKRRFSFGRKSENEKNERSLFESDEENEDDFTNDGEGFYEDEHEDFEDEFIDEDEEEPSFFEKLKMKFSKKTEKKKEKVKALVPKKEKDDFEEVDFIYNEDDEINEPTVLLSKNDAKISGRLIYEGLENESDFVIKKDLVKIGSLESGNDLVLHSNVISRHHAKITREGDQYFIEDLNSTNGTTVNGEMLSYKELVKLKKMDEISFADIVYKII